MKVVWGIVFILLLFSSSFCCCLVFVSRMIFGSSSSSLIGVGFVGVHLGSLPVSEYEIKFLELGLAYSYAIYF